MKKLILKAFRNQYGYDKMSIKNGIVYGHFNMRKFGIKPHIHKNKYNSIKEGKFNDMSVHTKDNGVRAIYNKENLIYSFGPNK